MLSSGHGKSLGMAACTAIVVGNMVGSGFYLSPAAVAPYGNLAILIWLIMGAGAICLGLTFAKLARLVPATGGPYAYTRLAYGDFPGFLIAWGYWISIWASLPVIAVAFAGVVVDLFPAIRSRGVVVFITLAAIWAVVLINLRGVSTAGVFAQITTYAKLVPFGAIALLGIFFIDPAHFSEFNPSGVPLLQASAALAPLTMFAYLGLEFGNRSGRRCPRSGTDHPTLDRARHCNRGSSLHPGNRGCHGLGPSSAVGEFCCSFFGCCQDPVGPPGRDRDLDRCGSVINWGT